MEPIFILDSKEVYEMATLYLRTKNFITDKDEVVQIKTKVHYTAGKKESKLHIKVNKV